MLGLKTLPPITCILSGILAFSQTTVESVQASFNKFALYRCVSWCTFFCVPTRIYVDWSLGMNWMRSFEPWQERILRMLRTQMCVYRFSAISWLNQLGRTDSIPTKVIKFQACSYQKLFVSPLKPSGIKYCSLFEVRMSERFLDKLFSVLKYDFSDIIRDHPRCSSQLEPSLNMDNWIITFKKSYNLSQSKKTRAVFNCKINTQLIW